ncbi:ankyrin repeat domain-containing protein [Wolbachia endosymbiont of Anopheles demeilloni]|uniref:ankyrin repeat domain-containing protein n=1 Tax=Wolbachia endosymbiont of Anopheles demeilloni TaxID=2748871 RepID=UPI001F43EAC4|nr:ankyrin repeat domain-containing protein [Wolbachia endosymbiont of Anopheles demeilloni]UIP92258.1 ankyrin repeat domain-containing protein [Wolbachia endosymbiont of Anopheles demeilloni]
MNEREQRELDELLMNSSKGENIQQITELIEAGANINAVTTVQKETPLHIAVRYGHKEVAELLLDRGANVNAVDKKGRTPLSIVVSDDYKIGYCDKPMVVRTIIAYAVVHSGITTKPECIVKNIELSKFWDDYQNEMMNVRLSNSNISLYQFL